MIWLWDEPKWVLRLNSKKHKFCWPSIRVSHICQVMYIYSILKKIHLPLFDMILSYLFGGPPPVGTGPILLALRKNIFFYPQKLFGIHLTTAIHPKFFSNLSQSILTPDQSFRAYCTSSQICVHTAQEIPLRSTRFFAGLFGQRISPLLVGDFKCLCTLW